MAGRAKLLADSYNCLSSVTSFIVQALISRLTASQRKESFSYSHVCFFTKAECNVSFGSFDAEALGQEFAQDPPNRLIASDSQTEGLMSFRCQSNSCVILVRK